MSLFDSIFDEHLVDKPVPLKSHIRPGLPRFKEELGAELDAYELRNLLRALTFSFTIEPAIDCCVWYRKLQKDLEILISNDEPTYGDKKGYGGTILLLGEYLPKHPGTNHPTIVLYIKNIRKATSNTGISPASLLVNVFAHEMYHAYFQERNTSGAYRPIPEVEEPLAELGALIYSYAFFNESSVFDNIIRFVEAKKDGLPQYSFGAWLFKKNDLFECLVIGNYLKTQDKSFSTLNEQRKAYCDFINDHIINDQDYIEAKCKLSELINSE